MSDHAATFVQVDQSTEPKWARLRRRLRLMHDAWRTRRILAELEPWQLKDIGISRADAQAEIARAPWDVKPIR